MYTHVCTKQTRYLSERQMRRLRPTTYPQIWNKHRPWATGLVVIKFAMSVPSMITLKKGMELLFKTSALSWRRQTRSIHPRWGHVIPYPPSVQIPFAEKLVLGTFLCCGMVSIPCWVLYNLEFYKTGGRKTEPTEADQETPEMREETEKTLEDQREVEEGER